MLAWVLAASSLGVAQETVTSYTLDGGGATSEDGLFRLEGVVGQADAGWLGDGFYQLRGGFLPSAAALPPTGGIVPAATRAVLGSDVTLTASPTGSPPFQYFWRRNGLLLEGETNAVLSLTNLTLDGLGAYTVVYVNEFGYHVSDPSLVSPDLPLSPVADEFADRLSLAGFSGFLVATNVGATLEPGEPRHAGQEGGRSVWFQWTPGMSGLGRLSTRGSAFDTVLAVYVENGSGDTPALTNLAVVAADDDRGGFLRSEVRFNVAPSLDYFIAVDGVGGEEGQLVLEWEFQRSFDVLPVITNQPESQVVPRFGAVEFEVDTSRAGVTYQWYRNGTILPTETSRVLAISSADLPDLGEYVVAVTNSTGLGLLSDGAVLEFGSSPGVFSQAKATRLSRPSLSPRGGATSPQPVVEDATFLWAAEAWPNQTLGAGGGMQGGFASISLGFADFQLYQNNSDVPDDCNSCLVPTSGAQWFLIVAEDDGLLTLDTEGSQIDTVMAAYVDTPDIFQLCGNLVGCDDNGAPDGIRSRLAFPAVADTAYLVSVSGAEGEQGIVQLNWKLCPSPAPMTYQQDQFVLLAQPNPAPYVEDPAYYWRRDGALVGVTDEPMLTLGPPPGPPQFFTVRYLQNEQGQFSNVTNVLGLIFTVDHALLMDEETTHFQMILSGVTNALFDLEYALPVENDCGTEWLWVSTTNFTLTSQETGLVLDIPADESSRFYRLRPPKPGSSLPED